MRLTHRDRQLLEQLVEAMEAMTVSEISTACFDGNRKYAYRRLHRLRQVGYVESKVTKREERQGAFYWITEDGLKIIGKEGGSIKKTLEVKQKKKRNRNREWTVRDIQIMTDLYHGRELTRSQIIQKYFSGKMQNGASRLHIYRIEGLVQSEVLWNIEKGRCQAHYRITERGIRLLEEHGLITEGGVRARDLGLSEKQRSYIISANEISFKIDNVPFVSAVMIKRKYQMDRTDLLVGGFKAKEGDYIVYILRANAEEATVKRIIKEIGLYKQAKEEKRRIYGYIVYYKSEDSRRLYDELTKTLVTGGLPVHVLPDNERGIWITRNLIFGNSLFPLLKPYDLITLTDSKYKFEYAAKAVDGTKYYVLELLTGNRMLLDRVLKEYKGTSLGERVDVLLFCWADDEEHIRERVANVEWMRVIPLAWPTKEVLQD